MLWIQANHISTPLQRRSSYHPSHKKRLVTVNVPNVTSSTSWVRGSRLQAVPKEEEPGVPVMEELSALGEMTLGKLPLELDDENSVIYDADNKRYFRDGDFYPRDEDYRLFPSYLWRNNIDIASWSSTAYYMAAIKHWRYSTFSMKFRTVWDVMHGHQSIIYYEEANSPIFLFTATHYLQEHKKIDPEASSIFVDTMVFDIDKHTSKGVLANLELKWDLEILMPTVPDTEIVKGSWFCIYKIQDDE